MFITLKVHKENFRHNPTCRLMNPKNKQGEIRKIILKEINTKLTEIREINQWKNTRSTID